MSDEERARQYARLFLQRLDEEAWEGYIFHGCPFGRSKRGVDLWLEYATFTTTN